MEQKIKAGGIMLAAVNKTHFIFKLNTKYPPPPRKTLPATKSPFAKTATSTTTETAFGHVTINKA